MKRTSHSYYAVFIDYGRRGLEAVVQPEITRREVVSRIKSGEYRDIGFIHFVNGLHVEDLTDELLSEAQEEVLEAAQ